MKEINIDVVHDELFNHNKPLLAYSADNDYQTWKKQIEEKLISLLGMEVIKENAVEDMHFEIEKIEDCETYTITHFTFESEKDCIVPCYFLVPKDNKKKHPVCICLQGHTTGYHVSLEKVKYERDNDAIKVNNFGIEAVKHGYIALCIEQRGMGIRSTPRIDRGKAETVACYHTAMTALLLGRTLIGERVWDVSRAIDILEQHYADICDLSDLSLMGTSGGGTATYYTMAVEKRIKTALSGFAVSTYRQSINHKWHCSCNYIPQIARYMDMGEIAACIAPRKLLIVNGEDDPIFLADGTRTVYKTIQAIYEQEGKPNYCNLIIIPNVPHRFQPEVAWPALEEMRKR